MIFTPKDITGLTILARVQDLDAKRVKLVYSHLSKSGNAVANHLRGGKSKNAAVIKAVKMLKRFAARELPPHPATVRFNYAR